MSCLSCDAYHKRLMLCLMNWWEQTWSWGARFLHIIWWGLWQFWCYGIAGEPPKRNLCLWYVQSCFNFRIFFLFPQEIQTFQVGVSLMRQYMQPVYLPCLWVSLESKCWLILVLNIWGDYICTHPRCMQVRMSYFLSAIAPWAHQGFLAISYNYLCSCPSQLQ